MSQIKSEEQEQDDLISPCNCCVSRTESERHSPEHTFVVCADTQFGISDMAIEVGISKLDSRVAMICLCGNHDVGNRPNQISTFRDDYLSFWCNKTFNIVLNTNLFSDPSDAKDLLNDQIRWLEQQLKYATENDASHIFCFRHHPWFLYDEEEEEEDLFNLVKVAYPVKAKDFIGDIHESYFHIKRENRKVAMDLFKKYGVAANFCGHFHQSVVTKTSFGMEHIITGPLSTIFSRSNENSLESNGFRVVTVREKQYSHRFVALNGE